MGRNKSKKPFAKLGDLSKQSDITVKQKELKNLKGGKKLSDTRFNPCGGILPQ